MSYTKFTEPKMGTFTAEVPQGWRVRGGMEHPQPGDRRPWIEAISPDNIYIACDPALPQSFCHFPGQSEGQFVSLAAGGLFLNLKPSAERIGDFYLKNIAARQFGNAQVPQRRSRPDMVELTKNLYRRDGSGSLASLQITADEIILHISQGGQAMVASLLSVAAFNGQYAMGMWAFWEANVYIYVAPPHLAVCAEEVRRQIKASMQFTPQMMALYQQDEATIYAAGQTVNAAQWNWFAGQQAAHRAQTAIGDSIISNYWSQQSANDSWLRGWEHNQSANDRLAQNYSDATMERQRLADDSVGKTYDVAAGYNYYWVERQTGNIIGTNTSEPPDYTNCYSQLRKL